MVLARRLSMVLTVSLAGAASAFVPATAGAGVVPAGHVAFVTPSGALDVTAVMSDGSTTPPVQIAPVTKVTAPKTVRVNDLVVSADRSWLAWSESVFKPDKTYGQLETSSRIGLRNIYSGKTITIKSEDVPLGFSGKTLVVVGAYARRLVTTPTPHFVRVPGNGYPVATYSKGVVDVAAAESTNSNLDRERLRLTTFGGSHTLLHEYDVGLSYRAVTANLDAVSPDGKKLVVERGNHQDFDGLGPSSIYDEFAMSTHSHKRQELGGYGKASAKWRLATIAFVGHSDQVWLAIHTGLGNVHGSVVRYVSGKWKLVASNAITVAGNPEGYALVQPGKWVPEKNSPADVWDPVPTSGAQLWFGAAMHQTSIEGSELVWVTNANPTNPEGT